MSEEKPKNLCQKLAEVVLAIDHVEKAGRNDFQKYSYVKATDIARAVRGELSKRNIYLVTDVIEIRNYEIPAREGVMQAVDVKVQFSFFDGDEPSTPPIVYHSYGTGTDKGDKAVYKAMTGALKYGLRNGFLIPDESDPEADTKTDIETGKASAKAVGDAKVADLKAKKMGKEPPTAALFYAWDDASQTAQVTGAEELMHINRDLLKPYWNSVAKAVIVNADELEGLKFQLENRNVVFKQLKAAS